VSSSPPTLDYRWRIDSQADWTTHFGNYERRTVLWQIAVGEVDGEPVVVILCGDVNGWTPMSFVRFEVVEGRIERVADYTHCPLILGAATSVVAEP
jgi:hypothetical protein